MSTIESLPPPIGTTSPPGRPGPSVAGGFGEPAAGVMATVRGTASPFSTANSRSPSS